MSADTRTTLTCDFCGIELADLHGDRQEARRFAKHELGWLYSWVPERGTYQDQCDRCRARRRLEKAIGRLEAQERDRQQRREELYVHRPRLAGQ